MNWDTESKTVFSHFGYCLSTSEQNEETRNCTYLTIMTFIPSPIISLEILSTNPFTTGNMGGPVVLMVV
jgi:hypothetical protein